MHVDHLNKANILYTIVQATIIIWWKLLTCIAAEINKSMHFGITLLKKALLMYYCKLVSIHVCICKSVP